MNAGSSAASMERQTTSAPTSALPAQPNPANWYHFEAQLPPMTHLPLDRISYYDTPSHTYMIASNSMCKEYRLIKFTKDDEKLDVHFLGATQDRSYMVNLVQTLKAGGTHVQAGKARGILGFVRFTKGYYAILITKRREVAKIGPHTIYEVRGTAMISLCEPPKESIFLRRRTDEDYYRDQFQKFELGDYFYFCPTYDITNTLQSNMTFRPGFGSEAPPIPLFGSLERRKKFVWNEFLLEPCCLSGPRPQNLPGSAVGPEYSCSMSQGIYVADAWLPWIVFAVRGCVAQCQVETTAMPVTIVLIGRTSKNFAGARYLRRGVNEDGHVANYVEVEQIVYQESSLTHFSTKGKFSSYVQVRGSVPVHWFHAMVNRPKPPILLGKTDPFFNSTRLHLEEIFRDFGAPVILMNLLKCNEKKKREGVLTGEYVKAYHLLTGHMPGVKDQLPLRYHAFDLRNAAERAWNSMAAFAEREGDDVGVFACDQHTVRLQCGVVRSNCVDCIDRTNLAQFFFGLHALGKQLASIGLLHHEIDIAQSQDAAYETMLRLYLKLGDAIAIQYGGSAQVGAGILHRGIGWDKVMGIRRLYNNLIVDKDKQLVTNLFLGLYEPCPNPLRLGNKLALPLHRRALALNATAAAAAAVSNGEGGGIDAAAWDGASTVVDDATAFAMRRVVDINEIDADYYLHCSSGPAVGTGEHIIDWWVEPLAVFSARFHAVTSSVEDVPRLTRYSTRQRKSHPVGASQSLSHRKNGDRTMGVDVASPNFSPLQRLQSCASDVTALSSASSAHGDEPFPFGSPTLTTSQGSIVNNNPNHNRSTYAYFLLGSDGCIVSCSKNSEWVSRARECWLLSLDHTAIHSGDLSDEEAEASLLTDMVPQPVLHATSSRTTSASSALWDNPRLVFPEAVSNAFFRATVQVDDPANAACQDAAPWEHKITHAEPPMFVVADPEPVLYWDRGPDYGKNCELVHNHQTFPDEVHHSLYKKEIDELRRTCDRPPRKEDAVRMKIVGLLRYGNPVEWDVHQLCDALEDIEGSDVLPQTIKLLHDEKMTGAKLMRFVHFDMFRQASLLRDFVALMRSVPVIDEHMFESYCRGPVEPDWAQLLTTGEASGYDLTPSVLSGGVVDGSSGLSSGSKVEDASSGVIAFPDITIAFLQSFIMDRLTTMTTERFLRHFTDCMCAPAEDAHDRRKLSGGVPRFDRLRYHDKLSGSDNRTPAAVVLHHTFWANTVINWITFNSKRLGLNLHRETSVDDAKLRAAEFFVWMVYAGLITRAETNIHVSGGTGIDVFGISGKDVLAERTSTLFTMPRLQSITVLNVPMCTSGADGETRGGSGNQSSSTGKTGGSTFITSHRGGDQTNTFVQVPASPRQLLQLARRSSNAMRTSQGPTLSSNSISSSAIVLPPPAAVPFSSAASPSLIGAQHALEFAETCANLAFAALSFLDEQTSSSMSSAESAFQHLTELAHVDLSLLNSESRLCFFVNIFNCLYIHAWLVALQLPSIDIRKFMHSYAYTIGGQYFTLNDIKHGIIRKNRPSAFDVLPPFYRCSDRRISLLPRECEGREFRSRVVLALIDVYLTPERLVEAVPYNPKLFTEDAPGSVGNVSLAHPIVYEDGFEIVEVDDSSDDEDALLDVPGSPVNTAGKRNRSNTTATGALNATGTGGIFASFFRREKAKGAHVPMHYCIALVPQFFLEQLNTIEMSFIASVYDPSQPQTSVNQGAAYPKLIQPLIGLEEFGRSADEVMRYFHRKRRQRGLGVSHAAPPTGGNHATLIGGGGGGSNGGVATSTSIFKGRM